MPDDSPQPEPPATPASGQPGPAPRQVPETKGSPGKTTPGPHQENAGERS